MAQNGRKFFRAGHFFAAAVDITGRFVRSLWRKSEGCLAKAEALNVEY